MDNITYILQSLLLAAGLLLSSYLMVMGMGDYTDHLFELARAKIMVGLSLAVFSVIYGLRIGIPSHKVKVL